MMTAQPVALPFAGRKGVSDGRWCRRNGGTARRGGGGNGATARAVAVTARNSERTNLPIHSLAPAATRMGFATRRATSGEGYFAFAISTA